FQAAQQLDPAINLEPGSKTPQTDPQAVAQHLVALTKVGQGHQLAGQGDVAEIGRALWRERELDPNINLEPRSTTPKTDPQAVAQHLVALTKVGQEHQRAGQEDVAGAIAAFQAAQQLDPNINLEPGSTPPKTDPQAVAQHLVALTKVDQGRQLAGQGDVA